MKTNKLEKLFDPKDKKPEPDWTDDEFYEGAWSWVDELELKYEDNTLEDSLVELNKD